MTRGGRRTTASCEELPEATVVRLERSCRSGRRILDARRGRAARAEAHRRERRARALLALPLGARAGAGGGRGGRAADRGRRAARARSPCWCARCKSEGAVIASALEERAVPARTCGAAAYFQRAEVRDVLAWLRALADPSDSGAVVRALSRPPVELRSVDVARLTQLARRRKLDMPSAVAAALEGPQLSEEGRDRARVFLRLYRSASSAFEDRRPDAFVLRLIERIGLRRQQVFATHADTVERLRNIAKLSELATAYMRREPHATARDFTRYLAAVAESGLREEEATGTPTAPAVQVMTMTRRGPRVRPRLRARAVRGAHAGPVPARGRRRAGRAAEGAPGRADGRERPRGGDAPAAARGDDARPEGPRARLGREPAQQGTNAAAVALLRGGAGGARRSRRRSSRRSCSAPPRDSTRPSGSCATSCSTRWRAWAAGWARCGSTPTSTSTRPCRATSS